MESLTEVRRKKYVNGRAFAKKSNSRDMRESWQAAIVRHVRRLDHIFHWLLNMTAFAQMVCG